MSDSTREKVARWRKKPVVIEAYQTETALEIETLEGTMRADPGDWIIMGIKGEQYPCKPDIFEATYEPADGLLTEQQKPVGTDETIGQVYHRVLTGCPDLWDDVSDPEEWEHDGRQMWEGMRAALLGEQQEPVGRVYAVNPENKVPRCEWFPSYQEPKAGDLFYLAPQQDRDREALEKEIKRAISRTIGMYAKGCTYDEIFDAILANTEADDE